MLPNVKTTAIAALTAAAVFATSLAPANALGKNERIFLQGVVTAVIVDRLIEGAQGRRQPFFAPQQQFYAARPQYRPQYQQQYQQQYQSQYQPQYQPQRSSLYSTPAARAFNSYGRGERVAIQQRLRAMGYYRAGIDGAFGPSTYDAALAYAQDSNQGNSLDSTSTAIVVYDSLIY